MYVFNLISLSEKFTVTSCSSPAGTRTLFYNQGHFKMADTSFGISSEERRAEQERAAIRNEIRRDYQRKINNPNAKGMVLDPAVVRWNHARHSSYQFFKATPKTSLLGVLFGLVPPLSMMYIFSKYKKYETRMYEEGKWKKPRALLRG